ncbi:MULTISPECIES: M23 family metallopeptidase [Mesorhizobium]|uniref:M23 family peptidase n=1 Tax=Mesorhizobium denitrificans TaxID=2294114 RepID=A0A371XFM0_9HYPH|nr:MULTISPECIES: M23 family metallopeptidase [Mesorhizobium]RFC68027.1 M23 family peptidase [Mesorhizobium denitrificans]
MRMLFQAALAAALFLPAQTFAQSLKPDEVYSSLATGVLSNPNPVAGADGRTHLAYEVLVTNPSRVFVTIDKVEAIDTGGNVLSQIAGDELAKMIERFGLQGALIAPGGTAIVFMDVALPDGSKVPGEILARITATRQMADKDGKPQPLPADYPLVANYSFAGAPATTEKAATLIEPPLRGKGWVSINGCCDAITSHRGAVMSINGHIRVPERFAIDWIKLDDKSLMYTGEATKLASYAYYGAEVHSVADGTVVNLYDETDEQIPSEDAKGINTANIGGNMLVIEIADGVYAFYAHLQRGSLKFKLGDKVKVGDVIGLLGNTGNSTAPHLHFYLMDGPSPLNANGLPFILSKFSSPGVVPEQELDNMFSGKPVKFDARLAGEHANQYPLNNQVVDFE